MSGTTGRVICNHFLLIFHFLRTHFLLFLFSKSSPNRIKLNRIENRKKKTIRFDLHTIRFDLGRNIRFDLGQNIRFDKQIRFDSI
jgi:hypothetical protein